MKICNGEHQSHRQIVYDELEVDVKGKLLRCPLCIAIERTFETEVNNWRAYGFTNSLDSDGSIDNSRI